MCKVLYTDLIAVLCLAMGYAYLSGPVVLGSEKTFDAQLHNSLVYLDQAKQQWAAEKQKAAKEVPTIEELASYLGTNKQRIDNLMALGVRYAITPVGEGRQTDVATMTQNVRVHAGFSRFYPAGTKYGPLPHWSTPPGSVYFRVVENNLDVLLLLGLLVLAVANIFLLVMTAGARRESA